MRDFKNMKRQRGRNRGSGGGTGGGGGGKPQHNANRAFDSNGPDNVKIRGHAQHVFEKYQQLARDAFSSGDRVLAENYLQHADHYFRVLRTIQPGRPPSEILGRDVLASGLDIDFEEEFEPAEEGSTEAASDGSGELGMAGEPPRAEARRDERYDRNEPRRDGYDREVRRDEVRYEPRRDTGEGFYRDRQDRQEPRGDYRDRPGQGQDRDRPDRDRQDRDRPTQDRPTQDRQAQDRQTQHRGDNRPDRFEGRQDNRRFEGRREERPYGQNNPQRFDDRRPEERRPDDNRAAGADPLAVVAPEGAPPFPSASAEAQPSPVLRSEDGDMSQAPAFLQGVGGEEGDRKPRARRRRTPRSFESADGGDAAPAEEA